MQRIARSFFTSLVLSLAATVPSLATPQSRAAGTGHAHHASTAPRTDHQLLVEAQAGPPDATVLELRVKDARGAAVTAMEDVHTRPMHLLITNPGLDALQHVHPELQPNGRWRVVINLAAPVEHLLFAEFTPHGGKPTLARAAVDRRASPTLGALMLPKATQPALKAVGPFQVGMYVQPTDRPQERLITFHVQRNGTPVTFAPYLGERGHAALFTQGATRLVHAHPTNDERPGHVTFRVPVVDGEPMRVWGQFLVEQEMVMADFVMDPQVTWEGK